MTYKKILIAVDNSAFSLKAAEIGFDLGHQLDAEVALLFVINRQKENVNIETGPTREVSEMILLKEAEETIDQLIKMYNGTKKLYRFTPEGFPKEEILNIAKEWEADLIVIGTHGRTGLSHLFKGSIAEHIAHHALVPVFIIPPGIK
ncbi:MAG: universal stress protein UspA [Sphingobacteriia bacterium 24-36-13]|jgi:nucleotide-binding universal stress UspA family protein|uniref:universal stress protein n=1 Tax=Chitinophagaceae TaxID=563835 RepID=UPI000BDA5848|nr:MULTISPECIES: universal stress protein [Chitinophagaceae]OYY11604.1 MAG: universal stress protein UspA [Sphingobacteriia bacterium 35-36-14]OYZ55308.1 MAG: universal stress protein UspA [Sphingobacteriia bacterium 24-36-13]OZA66268.1 MAG: universal stress protein UspA [Sphingobacteriia bacterium 39-36-14]RWZ89418.1 MAG: universal stress protein [Hydrotalea sp. AMD]HQS22845.1 universal stress protein [Sediminibacterium sp.]